MKRSIFVMVAALAAASLACSLIPNVSIPRLKTGPTETFEVSVPNPDSADTAEVTLKMGAGKLTLAGGAEKFLEGTVRYNVPEWKPSLTTTADGSGVALEQGPSGDAAGVPDMKTVVNEWDLQLGSLPLNLVVNAGAYQGQLDLSGVALRDLTIQDGASDVEVKFDSPNPEEMDTFTYHTGASQVKLTGLANANFQDMVFESGAGNYTLDFSGELQRDADVSVKSGLSRVELVVPAGMAVEITVSGGVTDVQTEGTWTSKGDVYSQPGTGAKLTIQVEMGLGTLSLVSQ